MLYGLSASGLRLFLYLHTYVLRVFLTVPAYVTLSSSSVAPTATAHLSFISVTLPQHDGSTLLSDTDTTYMHYHNTILKHDRKH